MAWIESHQSLSRHRKTLKTAGRLSVDRHKLIGHLMELWWWAIDNVGVDGRLTEMTHEEISEAAQWDGDSEEFLKALIDGGFIDKTSEGLVLHDWYDYAGKLIEARNKERERSRERRKKTSGRPADDQRTTVGTVPNSTVPNSTVPNSTKEENREDASNVPQKPNFRNRKPITSDVSEAETPHNEVSDAETPQSKVKESIVEESKVEESRETASTDNENHLVTVQEREILNILKGVKGYRFDYSKDLEFLRKLMVDFPQVDIGEEVKKWEVWLYDHPLTKKSNPRSQIRNWMKNAVKFSENKDKNRNRNGPVDRRKMSFEDYMQEAMTYAPE